MALRITTLSWTDVAAGEIARPGRPAPITLGLGSALARRRDDPPGRVWALGDRGPNLKPHEMAAFGVSGFDDAPRSAKIMPRLDLGPTLAELQVGPDGVRLVGTVPLRRPDGRPLTGIPPRQAADDEPALDMSAQPIAPDPDGADTEGVVAFSDGGFCVAEEYGPSLLWVDPDGQVRERWTPQGWDGAGALIPQRPLLPAVAARRRLNRGFEGLAISPDETRLFVALQSALKAPGEPADRVRIWTLEARTGALLAEHAYSFDQVGSFRRDAAAGPVDGRDLKICDAVCVGAARLLVLERISASAKLYLVDLAAPREVPLAKQLVFSTDDHADVAPDLEGVALLSDREVLLVTDNDFGVYGATTRFYRLSFSEPLA